jgi:hypothetical protein
MIIYLHELNTVFFIKSWLRDWPYEAAATIAIAKRCQFLQKLARAWQMKNSIVSELCLFFCEEAFLIARKGGTYIV